MHSKNLLIDSFNLKLKRYSQLKELTERLTTVVALDYTAGIILEKTIQLIPNFSSCLLYLINPKTYELNCYLSKTIDGSLVKAKKGDIFDQWVIKKMQPLLVEDVNKDFRFDVEMIDKEELRNIRSLIIAPLMTYNKIIGILRIDSLTPSCFNQEDLRLLVTISDLAAAAIDNAILYQHTLDLAIHDGLTSLYLKNYFLERLGEELQRASMKKGHLSILMLDIDKFKDFNDKFGHIAGDIVLKAVSKILQESAGKDANIICRFGGEEFAILLVDTDKEEALNLAEDLRKAIKAKEVILRRESLKITVSIGVVSCPDDGYELEDLMRKVDAFLYQAKRDGRDRVCFQEK
ncbi:MAG: sensor domain-containing diguanylate cyclase [Candidatus Omnitrophota bacterium]